MDSLVGNLEEQPIPQTLQAERGLNLEVLAKKLWAVKSRLLLSGCATALVCLLGVSLLPKEYTARTSFLPPDSSSSSSNLANQLGALGGMALMGGVKTPGDVYAGMLQSTSVQGTLVDDFNLKSVYHCKTRSAAIAKLESRTTIVVGLKDTIVVVNVMDHDPVRARDLANAYLKELEKVSTRIAVTEGAQRRRFYEERLLAEKEALADAEVEMKKSEENTGLVVPSSQAQQHFASIASLRSLKTTREIHLAGLLQTSTEQDPEVIQLRAEIASLDSQLNRLEHGGGAGGDIATNEVPKASLEYVRKQRDVRYHETMFELLAHQYENARLDEAKESPPPQILDIAVTPDTKSGPPRLLMVLSGFFLGVVGAGLYTFVFARKL